MAGFFLGGSSHVLIESNIRVEQMLGSPLDRSENRTHPLMSKRKASHIPVRIGISPIHHKSGIT
jgi:hypothetical protein